MAGNILIYGAYGYTAKLILEHAAGQALSLILAGRDEARLQPLAEQYGWEYRVLDLGSPASIDAGLDGIQAVLNCAGPFVRTARPMVDGCIRNQVHYLDITGEIEVFEDLAKRDQQARDVGVTLLPGCGFDVVPTDCMAAYLKAQLPDATELSLAFTGLDAVSHGTAVTMIESIDQGGMVRRNGELVSVPTAYRRRNIDMGWGSRPAVTIPWGDVSTAFYTTGIPNVCVYLAVPSLMAAAMRMMRYFSWALRPRFVKDFLKQRVDARPAGPDAQTRAKATTIVWGEACNPSGACQRAILRLPNGYTLTAWTALELARRVAGGDGRPGFQTPAGLFGVDFVLQFDDVVREDA